jgi:hypothetical protein
LRKNECFSVDYIARELADTENHQHESQAAFSSTCSRVELQEAFPRSTTYGIASSGGVHPKAKELTTGISIIAGSSDR